MAYLGRALTSGNYLKLDDISSQFNGSTTTFNLTSGGQAFYPGSPYSLIVSVAGVVQEPESAFQINENQIIFATAPGGSDDFFCIVLGLAVGIGVPADSSVTGNKLAKPFNYNNGHLYFDSVNDRLGINTTVPSTALDVIGDVTVSNDLTVSGNVSIAGVSTTFVSAVGIQSSGTPIGVGATQLNFIGLGNTFLYNSATNTVDISISGGGGGGDVSGIATALGTDNIVLVGIGTTGVNAGAANSEGALQVVGNIAITEGVLCTDSNIDSNIFIPEGKNGLLIGPVTVGAGFTVDVATDSVLVVV